MPGAWKNVPRTVIFLAGVAAGAVTAARRRRDPQAAEIELLKHSVETLEARLSAAESAAASRFGELETRIDEQGAKLAEIPTTGQIVAAMEQLLSKTMSSLDDRLHAQAQSIETLKTTVSQTDGLLEKVLESLDSLQPFSGDPSLSASSLVPTGAVED